MGINQRAQITMTDDEQATFLERSRVANLATVGLSGMPHLVAMWYALIDGELWFETKAKSQKAVNLRRELALCGECEEHENDGQRRQQRKQCRRQIAIRGFSADVVSDE